jgi:hypothetical protein
MVGARLGVALRTGVGGRVAVDGAVAGDALQAATITAMSDHLPAGKSFRATLTSHRVRADQLGEPYLGTVARSI